MAKKRKSKRPTEEVNSSSMADIAFLLLIFFLVTTTIVNEKGVRFVLPKKVENVTEDLKIPERNMLKVLLNSSNKMLVGGQVVSIENLKGKTKAFLSNRGKIKTLSDSPEKAIVSFKADRGSDFKTYLMVLDELKSSYHELRADYLNITNDEYLKLDPMDAEENAMLKQAKAEFPATLSEAEPNDFKQ
jgi:biopolymer transport protein ExbD